MPKDDEYKIILYNHEPVSVGTSVHKTNETVAVLIRACYVDRSSKLPKGLRQEEVTATSKMNTVSKKIVLLVTGLILIAIVGHAMADIEDLGMCIRNCAQCKKMLGAYFEGSLYADVCVKFKGKMIPDCENIDSVAPFLNKLE
ncbi:hypothetical protein QTP88_024820 [Uroleucon formosanum]